MALLFKFFPLFCFIALPITVASFNLYDGFHLISAIPSNLAQLIALRNFTDSVQKQSQLKGSSSADIEVWKFRPFVNEPTELFVGPARVQRVLDFLDANKIPNKALVKDFGIQMREAMQKVVAHDKPSEFSSTDQFDLGHYHPFDSILAYLRLLSKKYEYFVRFGTIGKTSEGRELPILTLGYPSAKGGPKPALFVDAGIHAREWIAPAVALHFINALINNATFHALLSEIDVHVVPVLNPDGYAHTWAKDRLWRRTRSGPKKADLKTCGTISSEDGDGENVCYGVDPNRNFPFHWGEAGISKCPCSQVYNGEVALSEPECANLAKFLGTHNRTIKAYLTLHAFSNLIIHPFGFSADTYPDNVEELRRVANAMAKSVKEAGGERFKVGSAPDVLYLVSGSSDDFAWSQGIKYTYTMELTSGWYGEKYVGFVYPEEGINTEAEQVLPALRLLAEEVRKEGGNGKSQ